MFDTLTARSPGSVARGAESPPVYRAAPPPGGVAGASSPPFVDRSASASCSAVLEQLAELRNQLSAVRAAAGGTDSWAARERQAVWSALDGLAGTLAAAKAAWLAADRAAGTAAALGDSSVAAAVDRRSGCGMRAAHEQVRQADALTAMPRVAEAVGGGRLPVAHLDVVARVLERSSGAVESALTSSEGQATVVRLAESTDVRRFSRDLGAWVASLDPAQLERDHQTQRAARFLHLAATADGTYLKGRLDRVSGELVRRALDRMGETPDDDRSSEQARADALTAMASTLLDLPVSGSVASVRPHVSLVVDASTFVSVRAELARRSAAEGRTDPAPPVHATAGTVEARMPVGAAGCVPTALPGSTPVAPACTEDGVPVPFSELTRMLCDAEVSRVVLGAGSSPLDLGRSVRLFSGAVRRAIVLRDQVCAFGGCGKPARWGEVHHISWWDRDAGETSVDNGLLLCVFHHHEVHRADLRVRRLPPDPADALPGVRPRPRYEFRTPDGRLVAAACPRPAARSATGPPPSDPRSFPASAGPGTPFDVGPPPV